VPSRWEAGLDQRMLGTALAQLMAEIGRNTGMPLN